MRVDQLVLALELTWAGLARCCSSWHLREAEQLALGLLRLAIPRQSPLLYVLALQCSARALTTAQAC